MPFAVDRIDHVEVFVRDLEASVAWYAEVLGNFRVQNDHQRRDRQGPDNTHVDNLTKSEYSLAHASYSWARALQRSIRAEA